MKLNNKGFLITGILYSLLLLFLVLIIGMVAIMNARQKKIDYISKDIITKLNDKYDFNIAKVWEFGYTGNYQIFTVPADGYYNIELWGAQGGNYSDTIQGGKGAYVKGLIYLTKGENLYIYVGSQPDVDTSKNQNEGGYNGGGRSGYHTNSISTGGGGATDIRLKVGEGEELELEFASLKSRIMVAAGGGGTAYSGSRTVIAGVGGAFIGGSGSGSHNEQLSYGGSQTAGGEGYTADGKEDRKGLFGSAFSPVASAISYGWGGGGGSGYYGGALGYGHGGGGGSSFVSGLYGCVAIKDTDNIVHKDEEDVSVHYSNKVFYNGMMIAGDASMPTHDGTTTMVGNTGNGYAKISLISTSPTGYQITNMLTNGNYENGTDGWTLSNAEIVQENCYQGTKCLHFIHDNGNDFISMSRQYDLGQPILNHKYYGVLMFKSIENFSTSDSRYEWIAADDLTNGTMVYVWKGNSITTWQKYSSIKSITSITYLTEDYTWQIRNFIRGANGDSYTDSVMLIDLTETFGEGNEPTKEWCDENISYFDDEITIYK